MTPLELDYQIYTVILFLFPFGCFVLIILQMISHAMLIDKEDGTSASSSRCTYCDQNKMLLYIIYSTGMACGLVGFSLHASTMPQWCEKYGFLPCFCFLGLSKAVLYVFFLRRAESAQGVTLTRCKTIVFRYVAPVYLFAYWIVYMVLTSIVFAGKLVDDHISHCVFARGAWWFSIFAACIDMVNALGSLALFIHPLVRAMQQAGLSRKNQKEYLQYLGFVTVMKWNIALTSIAAASSMAAVICFYTTQEYAWFFCLGDPFINALCTFLMLSPNRKLIGMICRCQLHCRVDDHHTQPIIYTMEIDGVVVNLARELNVETKTPPPNSDAEPTEPTEPGASSTIVVSETMDQGTQKC